MPILWNLRETMAPDQKTDQHLIRGCQSNTWLSHVYRNGLIYFQADNDALIVKGILGMMVDIFTGRSPREIMEAHISILDLIGLDDNLPQSRSTGIRQSVEMMISIAASYV